MTKSITRLMRQPRTHHSASGAKSRRHFFPSHLLNLNRERFVPYSGFRLHRDKIQKQKVIRSVAWVFVRNFNEPFMKAFVCLCEDINSLFFSGEMWKSASNLLLRLDGFCVWCFYATSVSTATTSFTERWRRKNPRMRTLRPFIPFSTATPS